MNRFARPLALLLVALPGLAQAGSGSEELHFDANVYVWMASLKGDIAAISGAPTIDVDASFNDILDDADVAAMLALDLRYRRLGFLADFVYLQISTDERTPGPVFGRAQLESTTFFTTLAPYFRAVEQERLALDILAGVRVWYVDTEIRLRPGIMPGGKVDQDESWADPVLGARGGLKILDWLSLSAAADLGGFGAASDFTWQALGTVDVRPWDWLTLRAGYRHLDVDYHHGGFEWDVAMSGPIIGLTLHF